MNMNRTGFMINIPIGAAAYGTIKLNVYSNALEPWPIYVSLTADTTRYFEIIWETIKEGFLWLVKEGPKIILAAFSRSFDLAQDIFSEENVKDTLRGLFNGTITFDDAAESGLRGAMDVMSEFFGLCTETNAAVPDGRVSTSLLDSLAIE